MKRHHETFRVALFALATAFGLAACKDETPPLVTNPTFAWCGDTVCSWQVTGVVKKVPTWHPNDYAVSLEGHDVVLSQFSQHNSTTPCLAFSIMGLVAASAELTLELDYQDDGIIEHVEHIPASEWQTVHYVVATPDWFDGVRVILRKQGAGVAMLSLVQIEESDQCSGTRPAGVDKRAGVSCTDTTQCAQGACRAPGLPKSCKRCLKDADCGSDANDSCQRLPLGCPSTGTCDSTPGLCYGPSYANLDCQAHGYTVCSDCSADADCGAGELCVHHELYGECRAQGTLRLAELCTRDRECASARCKNGACSECSADADCSGAGALCGPSGLSELGGKYALANQPSICFPRTSIRTHGSECLSEDDCQSGVCSHLQLTCSDDQHRCDADQFCECATLATAQVTASGTCR